MQLPIIKYYNPSIDKPEFCFYILCKGLHSGKPLKAPIPNCYIAICETQIQHDYFFWLIYGIFHTRLFENDLIGSVIPFLRIGDFKKRLSKAFTNTCKRPNGFNKAVCAMKSHYEQSIKINELLKQKHAILQSTLKYHILAP